MIRGRRPNLSEMVPMTGLASKEVSPCAPKSNPASPACNPTDRAYKGRNAIRAPRARVLAASARLVRRSARWPAACLRPWSAAAMPILLSPVLCPLVVVPGADAKTRTAPASPTTPAATKVVENPEA